MVMLLVHRLNEKCKHSDKPDFGFSKLELKIFLIKYGRADKSQKSAKYSISRMSFSQF